MGLLSRKKDGDDDGNRKALFGSRKSDSDRQPLLPQYENDDTKLQHELHKKLHSYQQVRALTKGYMPPQARTPMHSRHHSTRAPTTGTARTRHQQ